MNRCYGFGFGQGAGTVERGFTTTSIEECKAMNPDFVVVVVNKTSIADVSKEWMEYGFTVLCETPAALDTDTLNELWEVHSTFSGSQLAESESEKRIVVFLAEKQQAIVGMGTIGFDIIEMPWKSNSFENDKAFILHMIHHARALSLEQSVWEQLGYKPDQKLLEYALSSFEILIKRMTINNIDEKNLLEWLSASEIADPINSGFPKCPKHKVLLSFLG